MERMTELQQSKYQDLQAGLPSELSMQLAEVSLALGSAEDQVTSLGTVYSLLNVVLCCVALCTNWCLVGLLSNCMACVLC